LYKKGGGTPPWDAVRDHVLFQNNFARSWKKTAQGGEERKNPALRGQNMVGAKRKRGKERGAERATNLTRD